MNYASQQNPMTGRAVHMGADNNQDIPHPLLPDSMRAGEQNVHHDSVVPSIDSLRHNSTLSQAVSRIMATYDDHVRMEAGQGKASTIRCSGHYNTTDLVQAPPETRWANEGFHSGQGKKRVVYDDLSLTQWAVGQLSNVYLMKDAAVSKQVLLQVILALKDATSLPWQAV